MSGQTTSEYISHHLSFLKTGDGFWHVHVDTLFFSILAAVIFLFIFSRVAKKPQQVCPEKCNVWWKLLWNGLMVL
ncbi:ATP synthase subunit a [Rodentibacter pneumotropicus]|uniref:ATP synthase subunit a n=1 Tax=Rodentibacter pneumotropicus TaxID=758 RepID=A0A448MJ54_9PAST|nr:ATP synthase subunit a [Rodentibacter pneumotropicus]